MVSSLWFFNALKICDQIILKVSTNYLAHKIGYNFALRCLQNVPIVFYLIGASETECKGMIFLMDLLNWLKQKLALTRGWKKYCIKWTELLLV